MSGHDIFISYSREDRPAARHFADSFAREGFSVWWDAALRSGQTFDEVIEKELRAAKAVVVLWSPRSVASRWVRAEATLADRRNKLVPAIIEACDLPIIFELTHAANLADWKGDTADARWQGLISDLRGLVGEEGSKEEASSPVEPAQPVAKPKAGASASSKPWPAQLDDDDADSAIEDDIDGLMFGSAGRSSARGKPDRRPPVEVEDTSQTQFCAPSDAFDLMRGDEFHCLQMIDGERQDTRFVVSPLGLKIGRNAPADIILAYAGVSRAHCLVELADERLRVADLNSTNGTFIDDERIDRVGFLGVGSVLRIGNISFRHEVHPRAELQRPTAPAPLNRATSPRAAGLARSS